MNKALTLKWSVRTQRVFLLVIFALYAMLFLPFWKEMIMGFIFASACAPYLRILRQRLATRSNSVGYWAVVVATLVIIAVVGLAAFQFYSLVYGIVSSPARIAEYNGKLTGLRDSLLHFLGNRRFLARFDFKQQLDQLILTVSESGRTYALAAGAAFLAAAPDILLSFAIFLGAFAAFLVGADRIFTTTAQIFQLKNSSWKHFDNFERICGIALGSVLLIGSAQSFLVTIGAFIAGYRSVFPVFVATFIFSLVPVLGAGLMGAVLAVVSLLQGDYSGAIIMGVTACIAGVADNILRPYLFSRAAQTNPLLSLISLFGGVALFGFAGLFIAPVLEQMAMTYVLHEKYAANQDAARTPEPAAEAAPPPETISQAS